MSLIKVLYVSFEKLIIAKLSIYIYIIIFINLLINILDSNINILNPSLLINISFKVLNQILVDYFSLYKVFKNFKTWVGYNLLIWFSG
jgi:hypothetical protein